MDLQPLLAEPQPSPGRFTRAYLKASLKGDADEDAVSAALVSAVAHAPQLLQPLHDAYRQWNAQLDADGLQEGVSLLVRLAIDGLWFSELIGLGPPRAASRKALVRQLHRLVTP